VVVGADKRTTIKMAVAVQVVLELEQRSVLPLAQLMQLLWALVEQQIHKAVVLLFLA
jgi:hypothetical protein